jgi:glycosyltransferase involved in cell wall biosynthesis
MVRPKTNNKHSELTCKLFSMNASAKSESIISAAQRERALTMKPLVTIGMCARNSERTVGAAVQSIVNQGFPHDLIEIIFVDDGSNDHTPQILFDYVRKINIKSKFIQTKSRGLGPARNLIYRNALGDFILWVDADEILTHDYLEKQVHFMESHPEVGITSGIVKLNPKNFILNLELIPEIVNRLNYEKPKSFLWKTDKMPGTGASTYRMAALRGVNGFHESLTGVGEDQDIAKRIQNLVWLIRYNDAGFYEFHGGLATFEDLWKKYLWYGYGCKKIYGRERRIFSLPRMSPLAGFATGFFYSLSAYRLFHQKAVFFLPFHYSFKMTAWMLGFMKSQIRIRRIDPSAQL